MDDDRPGELMGDKTEDGQGVERARTSGEFTWAIWKTVIGTSASMRWDGLTSRNWSSMLVSWARQRATPGKPTGAGVRRLRLFDWQ
jgi:hypothetical protein